MGIEPISIWLQTKFALPWFMHPQIKKAPVKELYKYICLLTLYHKAPVERISPANHRNCLYSNIVVH